MDYERFVRMLHAANIKHTIRRSSGVHEVSVASCSGEQNSGHDGLYTTFVFNAEGDLESVGVWEGSPPVVKAA